MGVIWCLLTIVFMTMDEWNRALIVKGLIGWAFIFATSNIYPKFKSFYGNYKKQKSRNARIQNPQLNENKLIHS